MKGTSGIVTLLVMILLCAPAAGGTEKKPLLIATGEWPPYTSDTMENQGIATGIVRRAFRQMGVTIELVFYPWARCYESVRTGKVWGAFPYARTEERAGQVDFSDILLYSTSKLFYFDRPPKDLRFKTLADLVPFRIGGVSGFYSESLLKKAGIEADYAPKPRNGFEKLMLGRTDLFVSNELAGWHLIHSSFPRRAHRFGTVSRPLDRNGLRMIVSREHPEGEALLQKFNASLAEVKNELFYRLLMRQLRSCGRPDGD